MSKILFVLLAGLFAYASAVDGTIACQYIVSGGSVYNFYGFYATNVTYVDVLEGNQNITFDLCSPDITGCSSGTEVTAKSVNTVDDNCLNLADKNSPTVSYLNASDADAGVIITFPTVFNSVENENVTFIASVSCDSSVDINSIPWTVSVSTNSTGTYYTLTGAGEPGCPIFTLASYLEFFNEYKYLFASFCLLIGLFALLAGLRFFNITIFIFATIVVTAVLFIIILAFTGLEISTGAQWGIFAGCVLVGLGCGYGAVKLERAGFFALGALFGGIAALFLYGLLLHFFNLGNVALYIIIVVFALIGGGFAIWLWKDIIIISTSCIGGYLVVRALSFYIGGFPNELDVVEGVQSYDYVDYVYLFFMIVVAIGGIWFQYRKKKRDEENEKEINQAQTETEMTLSESITRY